MFDLTIFPLSLETGREQYELPGLLVVSAPRRAARMRAHDQLVLYCKLRTIAASGAGGTSAGSSNAITHGQLREILSRLAETYFTFSGSVTAGLRVVSARLNDFLLNRNLKAAQEGQTIGTLNLAVIHGNRLVVAHTGATHSFVLTKTEVLHFDDGMGGRGLGLSRQIMPHFHQATLDSGDLLMVCADPPAAWNAKTLANSPQLSFDHLRRRLSGNAGVDLQVGVIRLQAGKGQISYWRPGEAGRAAGRTEGRTPPQPRHAGPSTATPLHSVEKEAPVVPEPITESRAAVTEPTSFSPLDSSQTVPTDLSLETDISVKVDYPAEADFSADISMDIPVSEDEDSGGSADAVDPSPAPARAAAYSVPELHDEILTPEDQGSGALDVAQIDDAHKNGAEHNVETSGSFLDDVAAIGTRPAAPVSMPTARPGRRIQVDAPGVHPQDSSSGTRMASGGHGEQSTSGRQVREGALRDRSAAQRARERRTPAVRPGPRKPGALQMGLAAASANVRLGLYKTAQFIARSGRKISGVLSKVAPQQPDMEGRAAPFFNLSPAQMVAIAIFVPLIVVAVGTTVYVRSGLSEQFQQHLAAAQGYAQQATQQTDPVLQRETWRQSYAMLAEIDKLRLGSSDESVALKKQVNEALDGLEGYVRLDYQPAISGGLPQDVNITRMVTTLNDVYLLDASQGRILRLMRTSTNYIIDTQFSCGAGTAGTVIINPLIDLVALPTNNEMHGTVMGIDAGGNLVYCAPNLTGFDSRPLALPDNGWGNIVGITTYGNALYVLDPKGNAVYRYDGADGVFTERPHLYFDNTIPQMADVVDLAVDQEFLYLLHADGKMTLCQSSGFDFAANKCTDPAPYGDARPGYDPAPLIFPGSHFTHIQTTQPPDPSLFALDAANKAIYHLSLRRLNLQRQYRPVVDGNFPLPNSEATAFAIAPNRRALIAFGNRLFFAPLP